MKSKKCTYGVKGCSGDIGHENTSKKNVGSKVMKLRAGKNNYYVSWTSNTKLDAKLQASMKAVLTASLKYHEAGVKYARLHLERLNADN